MDQINLTPNLIKHFANYLRLELSLSDNSVEAYCHDVHLFLQYLEADKKSTDINAITQETTQRTKAVADGTHALHEVVLALPHPRGNRRDRPHRAHLLTHPGTPSPRGAHLRGNPEDDRQHRPQPTHRPPQQGDD